MHHDAAKRIAQLEQRIARLEAMIGAGSSERDRVRAEVAAARAQGMTVREYLKSKRGER